MSRQTLVMCPLLVLLAASIALAQYTQLSTPVTRVSDSYFERFGLGWNVEGPNWFFRFPGLNAALPPFGGWDPGGDATFGFGGRNGSTRFGFNMAMQQGSTRSLTGVAPTVVVPNGYGGTIFDGSVRPFVTGLVPVVGQRNRGALFTAADQYRAAREHKIGQWETAIAKYKADEARREADVDRPVAKGPAKIDDAPLAIGEAEPESKKVTQSGGGGGTNSSANRGDLSVSEIKRQLASQDGAKRARVAQLIEQGRGAEALGKKGVAKIFYRQAANRASGELRRQLMAKVKSLSPQPSLAKDKR